MNIKSFDIVLSDANEVVKNLGKKMEILSGKTVLITGANGVVGSYFAYSIYALNAKNKGKNKTTCICLTRHKVTKSSRLGFLLNKPNMHFIVGDVTKKISVPKKIDYIIHSASYASPKSYLSKPIETMEANSIGTKNLLDIAKKHNSSNMMFISSASIYGDARKGEGAFTEDHCGYVSPLEMRAVYSESKRFGETLCTIYSKNYDVHTTIARLSNMYGPGFNLDDGRAVPDFFNQAFNEGRIEINGDPSSTRAYVYISDAITGMFHILLRGRSGEAYNISSETSFAMKDVAKKVSSFFPKCEVVIKFDKKKSYLLSAPVTVKVSSKKLEKEFGWKQTVEISDGLERLYSWYNKK